MTPDSRRRGPDRKLFGVRDLSGRTAPTLLGSMAESVDRAATRSDPTGSNRCPDPTGSNRQFPERTLRAPPVGDLYQSATDPTGSNRQCPERTLRAPRLATFIDAPKAYFRVPHPERRFGRQCPDRK